MITGMLIGVVIGTFVGRFVYDFVHRSRLVGDLILAREETMDYDYLFVELYGPVDFKSRKYALLKVKTRK